MIVIFGGGSDICFNQMAWRIRDHDGGGIIRRDFSFMVCFAKKSLVSAASIELLEVGHRPVFERGRGLDYKKGAHRE